MPIRRPEERLGAVMADRYRLDRLLGQGGMGLVYAAVHTYTGRKLAVKVMLPRFLEEPAVLKRFFQEAKATASLAHPNVVEVLDSGEDESGDAYIAMELLEGENLAERLERGSLSPAEALEITLPIVDGLRLAHEHGIVHRDIKPENIFLHQPADGPMVPKVLDFGVAKLLQRQRTLTQTGAVMGTPYFLSPEQAGSGASISPATDVWAVGVVLLYAIGGVRPFEDEEPARMMVRVATTQLPPVSELVDGFPKALGAVVSRCLALHPEERFDSMVELGQALVLAAAEDGVEAIAPSDALMPADGAKLSDLDRGESASSGGEELLDTPERDRPPLAGSPPSAKRAWAWGGLTTLTVVALALALGTLGPEDESSAPTSDGVEQPATVIRRLVTSPAGATAVINGMDAGHTPIDLEVPMNASVPVRLVRRGYYPQEVYVAATDPSRIEIELRPSEDGTPIVPDTYQRTVASVPPGATVTVGGESRGTTPVALTVDPESSLRVEVTMPGYWPSQIFLSASDPEVVEVELHPQN